MSITQSILLLFLLFALTRVIARFRSAELSFPGLLLWSGIFTVAIIIVLFPSMTSVVAHRVGVGRGADAVIYLSIVLLFYLVFRLYVYMQDIRRQISELVTQLSLMDIKNEKKSPSKN